MPHHMISGDQTISHRRKGARAPSENILAVNEESLRGDVRKTVEDTLNKKAFDSIEAWSTRHLNGEYPASLSTVSTSSAAAGAAPTKTCVDVH